MKIKELNLKGVFEIQLESKEDSRGFFMRTYDKKIFGQWGLNQEWVQESHSLSKLKGTIRGLHFQFPPDAEIKLVRMVSGELMEVYVDLRKDSSTFGQWGDLILSAKKKNMLYLPKGFAHGICTLTDNCNILYKMDNYYAQYNEYNIKWDDSDIGIKWPIDEPIVISDRDRTAPSFREFVEKYRGLDI